MNTRRFLAVGICAVVSALALRVIVRSVEETEPITPRVVRPGANIDAAARSLRPNYPYSVIPGGAYSRAELRVVNQRDPLVREHYSDFNVNAAQLVTLTADRFQYVSYRLHNQIFWTRKRLRILKGEVLLTDGRHYARTRCGNRLSPTAMAQTSPLQPPDKLLSLPPFNPQLLSSGLIQPAPAPPPGELAQEFPVLPFDSPRLAPYVPPETEANLRMPENSPEMGGSMFPVTPGFPAPAVTPSNTLPPPGPRFVPAPPEEVAAVPEPSSLFLFGIALCVSGWLLGRMAHASGEARTREGEK